jgi:hypothetical protein
MKRKSVGASGLTDKEWRDCLDSYMYGHGMTPDTHDKMNDRQKWMIHELDKFNTRNKVSKEEVEHDQDLHEEEVLTEELINNS